MPPGCWPVVRLDPGAAQGQTVFLGLGHLQSSVVQIFLHVAVSGLFRHGADGAGPEHVALAEELKGVFVGVGLVFAREVQVDVGDLVAAEAQEGLKGDVEAVLDVFGAADGADPVGHVRAAAIPLPRVQNPRACSWGSGNGAAGS